MRWDHVAATFFGGVFLANFVPHLVAGVSGRDFPTPFAKPPFRGLSTPVVNVLWSLINLTVAYALLIVVGHLELLDVGRVGVAASGFGLASLFIARSVTKLRGLARIR